MLLKPFIIGQVCENCDEAMLQQVGKALAALHQIPAPDFLPSKHPYGRQVFHTVIGKNIDLVYESWLAEQATYLARAIPSNLPRALIHGDLFFDNVLFAGQVFSAIIDFEEACYYYRIFDLGMAVLGFCTVGTTIDLDKARTFVSGYQQGQQLEEREKEILQLFVEYAATATSFWRFWKYNVHMALPEKADNHIQMVRLAEAVRAIPKATFLNAIFS